MTVVHPVVGHRSTGDRPSSPRALRRTFPAMASTVTMTVVDPGETASGALDRAREVIESVASTCTRFDPDSALMRANAAGRSWVPVPRECFDAVRAAHHAHRATGGMFDPRVLTALVEAGYDRSLPFSSGAVSIERPRATGTRTVPCVRDWRPRFDARRLRVRIGDRPIDLGGIGKGLAAQWAAERLRDHARAGLVEAGGDIAAFGSGPDGEGWHVGVEDPFGGSQPVAVLRVRDAGVATSSVRLRSWTVDGHRMHHLIDPRSQQPGGRGLVSVSVVADGPAAAEVWSKVLFLHGRPGIRAAADDRGIPALWVDRAGRVGTSRALRPYLLWRR